MMTVLKISNVENYRFNNIFSDFEEMNGFDISKKILVKESHCKNFEFLYILANQYELNSLINIMLNYRIPIHSKDNFTEKLINIMLNNELTNFKNKFTFIEYLDNILLEFSQENLNIDMILDKANKFGFKSLSETDYAILNS